MGIRFSCPNGHKLNVKTFLAGKRAICPDCGAKVIVPSLLEQTNAPSFDDSPSIAIVGGPAPEFLAEAAAPSVLIAVAEPEPLAPDRIEDRTASTPVALPESIIAATIPSTVAAQPATGTAESVYDPQRERARRNQMLMAVGLLFVVVVLAGILLWVLKRGASPAPTSEPAPAKSTGVAPYSVYLLRQAKA
jgi:hypothetical protein